MREYRDLEDRIKKLEKAVNLPEQYGGKWENAKSGDIRVVTGEDAKVYLEVKTRNGVYTTVAGAFGLHGSTRPDATNLSIELTQIINQITAVYETFYEYYYWFNAVSPSTFDEKIRIGFGVISLIESGGMITATSSGEFTVDMTIITNQGIAYDRVDINTINFYPPTSWGTLAIQIYKPKVP